MSETNRPGNNFVEYRRLELQHEEVGIVRIERWVQVFFYSGKIDPIVFRSRMVALQQNTQHGQQKKNQQGFSGGMVFQRFQPLDLRLALRSAGSAACVV